MSKAVLITGAARGIGRALCAEGLRRGYRVHALVRKPGTAPAGTTEHVGDIRDRAAMGTLLKRLAPELDAYVANAGVGGHLSPRKPESAEEAAQVFDVNCTATVFSAYALAHEWIASPRPGRRMAFVSSLSAGRGLPHTSAYAASKTAQVTFADGFARDVGKYGIGVSVALPGFIDTEMSAEVPHRPGLISAEDAARRIFDGMERGKLRNAFPATTALTSWVINRMPYFLFRALVSVAMKFKIV